MHMLKISDPPIGAEPVIPPNIIAIAKRVTGSDMAILIMCCVFFPEAGVPAVSLFLFMNKKPAAAK